MAKRGATSELNHENWDNKEKRQTHGTFQMVGPDEMKNRVIKIVKRKCNILNNSEENTFSGFQGLKFATNSISNTSATKPLVETFSFLSNLKPNSSEYSPTSIKKLKSEDNSILGKMEMNAPVVNTKFSINTSVNKDCDRLNEYYTELRGLNESVSRWIKTHVDSNPMCILTPIFEDYKKYIEEIEEKYKDVRYDPIKIANASLFKGELSKTNESMTLANCLKSRDKVLNTVQAVVNNSLAPENSSKNSESKSILGTHSLPSNNVGQLEAKPKVGESKEKNPFTSNITNNSPTLNFGSGLGSSFASGTIPSSNFPLGGGKPFTFTNVSKPEILKEKHTEEGDEDKPPKVEFTPVVEEGAIYSKRCKVFVKKDSYQDHGVGTLFLKPVSDGAKTQLIVRADTSLGNLLINTLLTASMPLQKMGSNNVMLVCIPTPEAGATPVPVLFRVKTGSDADEVLQKLQQYQK